nr:hypothetical protein [uncultured Selenomonas sp.]
MGVDFCPFKETNRTHSKGCVKDLSTQRGRKKYVKTAVPNLSVLSKKGLRAQPRCSPTAL